MYLDKDPEVEEIVSDPRKQPLTNAEASYLLHDSYNKKTKQMDRRGKTVFIHPVFLEFLEYIQQFPHLRYVDDMSGEDFEALKERLKKTKKARAELEKFSEINELEQVQLYNLCPSSVEEAISWIPTLERFQEAGKEMYLKTIIEVVQKHTPIDPRA